MVAGVEREMRSGMETKRTYKVKPGPPNEMSYAKDIAYKYGIGFEQMLEAFKQRGVFRG